MATRAPSLASRRAMPRPIRFAAPVTSTVLDCRLTVYLYFIGLDALQGRLGEASGPVGPSPKERRGRTERARARADHARIVVLRGDARQHHGDHHGRPDHRFHGGEYTAAKFIRHMGEDLIDI